jgi:hypothetical protein
MCIHCHSHFDIFLRKDYATERVDLIAIDPYGLIFESAQPKMPYIIHTDEVISIT